MLRRLVVTLIGQYQSITSAGVEPNDANGKLRVWNSDRTNFTEHEWSEIDWENTGWTTIQGTLPP